MYIIKWFENHCFGNSFIDTLPCTDGNVRNRLSCFNFTGTLFHGEKFVEGKEMLFINKRKKAIKESPITCQHKHLWTVFPSMLCTESVACSYLFCFVVLALQSDTSLILLEALFFGNASPSSVHSQDMQVSEYCVCLFDIYRERCYCLPRSAVGTAALLSCSPPRSSFWEQENKQLDDLWRRGQLDYVVSTFLHKSG